MRIGKLFQACIEFLKRNFRPILETVALVTALGVLFVYLAQLRVMQKTLRMDQRAWITVTYGSTFDVKENEPVYIPTTLTDTGKTAAKNVEGFVFVSPVKRDATPDFGPTHTPGVGYTRQALRIGMFTPNNPYTIPLVAIRPEVGGAAPIIFTPELKQEVETGQSIIIAYGQITYDDVFGVKHWLHFCGIHGSIMSTAARKCSAYNDTDND